MNLNVSDAPWLSSAIRYHILVSTTKLLVPTTYSRFFSRYTRKLYQSSSYPSTQYTLGWRDAHGDFVPATQQPSNKWPWTPPSQWMTHDWQQVLNSEMPPKTQKADLTAPSILFWTKKQSTVIIIAAGLHGNKVINYHIWRWIKLDEIDTILKLKMTSHHSKYE